MSIILEGLPINTLMDFFLIALIIFKAASSAAVVKVFSISAIFFSLTAVGTTSYTYYDNGSRASVDYPGGAKEVYTYYKDNLLYTLKNYDSTDALIESYLYQYDGAHNLTNKTDPKGSTTYTHDGIGNRDTELINNNGTKTFTEYDYNDLNWLKQRISSLQMYDFVALKMYILVIIPVIFLCVKKCW